MSLVLKTDFLDNSLPIRQINGEVKCLWMIIICDCFWELAFVICFWAQIELKIYNQANFVNVAPKPSEAIIKLELYN